MHFSKMPIVLIIVGALVISLAVLYTFQWYSSCTEIIPGHPYYCSTPTLVFDPIDALLLSIATAVAGLCFGAAAIMFLKAPRSEVSPVMPPATM